MLPATLRPSGQRRQAGFHQVVHPRALLILALASSQLLHGQDAEVPPPTVDLRVDVTATAPELIAADSFEGDDLNRAGRDDLAAALREQPGLDASRRGALNFDPTVRALAESQLNIGVDGTRTFAAGPGRMDSDLAHISPHAVQSVRVIKGPYALTTGAGSLSAIDVRTFRPGFGGPSVGALLSADYEDNGDAFDAYASVFGSSDRYRWTLLYNAREGSDFEDGHRDQVPGDYSSDDLRGSVGFGIARNGMLELSGGYQGQDDLDYPGRLLDGTYFKTRSYNAEYSWSGASGALESWRAQVYANHKDHLMNNNEKPTARDMPGRVPPFGLDIELPTESNTAGGRLEATFANQRGGPQWAVGTDLLQVDQSAQRFIRRRSNGFLLFQDIVWPEADLEILGLWARGTWNRDRWSVSAAMRVDQVDFSAGQTSDFFRLNTAGDLEQSEDNVNASLAARFAISDQWTLSAGVGSVTRTANTLERSSDRFPSTRFQVAAEFLGDPLLDPERSLQFDLGIAHQSARWTFRADLYDRTVDDFITVLPDQSVPKRLPLSPPIVFRYINGTEATYQGGELFLEHRAHQLLSWSAAWVTTRADDELFEEPLFGVSPDRLTLRLDLHTADRRLALALTANLFEDQDRVAASRFEVPTQGAETVDLLGTWQLRRGFRVHLGVDNLTDEAFARHLNSLNPFTGQRVLEEGRGYRLGIRWSS